MNLFKASMVSFTASIVSFFIIRKILVQSHSEDMKLYYMHVKLSHEVHEVIVAFYPRSF